jgi:glycosyltransferase involved in cell wall biosynthesis
MSVHHELTRDSGAPGATLQLADELRAQGHEVSLYSWDQLPSRLSARAKELLFGIFLCVHLRRADRRARPDVVDAMTGDAWLWALLRRRGSAAPALLTRAHGLEHRFFAQQLAEANARGEPVGRITRLYHGHLRLWQVGRSLRSAEVCLFLNEADRKYAVAQLGVAAERARTVSNGVSASLIERGRALPSPTGPPRVAVVGSWAERKGIDYGVPALNALLGRHAELSVLLLGTGTAAAAVKERFDPRVLDRLEVVEAYARDELPELLSGTHILLFPTLAEGQSLALLETMACGLVPVTTAAGGEGVVHDGANGLLVPERDSDALVAAVERLLLDRTLLGRLRAGALESAAGRTWAAAATQTVGLYEEAAALRRAV